MSKNHPYRYKVETVSIPLAIFLIAAIIILFLLNSCTAQKEITRHHTFKADKNSSYVYLAVDNSREFIFKWDANTHYGYEDIQIDSKLSDDKKEMEIVAKNVRRKVWSKKFER